MSEELVKHARGRTLPFYHRHEALRIGQIAPAGTCTQWRSDLKVRALQYKAYFDLTDELYDKSTVTGPWETAEHHLHVEFCRAMALIAPIIRRVTNEDYFYEYLKDQETPKY